MRKRNKTGKFEKNGSVDLVEPLFVRLRPGLKAMLSRYAESRGQKLAEIVDLLIAEALSTAGATRRDIAEKEEPMVAPKKGLSFIVPAGKPPRFY